MQLCIRSSKLRFYFQLYIDFKENCLKIIKLAAKFFTMQISKSKLNLFSSLKSSKLRKKNKLFYVEGEKSVKDTISHFKIEAIIYLEGKHFDFIPAGVAAYNVNQGVLNKLSSLVNPPDIIAIYRYPENEASIPEKLEEEYYIVLDGIQDPGNLGTIIRTCHWFGIKQIFASKDTVDIYNPKTIQSTMGSISKVKVTYCNLEDLFQRHPSLPVYGLLLDGENIFEASLEKKGFILFGNEGKGISGQIRKYVTEKLLIPPGSEDHSESLNVGVAAGITIAQFLK